MRRELSKRIVEQALNCGFENCGIIPISDLEGYQERLEERKSRVSQSAGFYQRLERFNQVQTLYPWAKSIIVCTVWYGKYQFPPSLQGKYAKAYLLAEDRESNTEGYRKRKAFEQWMAETGIHFAGGDEHAPGGIFPLRYAALKAGLGIIRKNNFFYTEKGSYYALNGYVIDRECEYRQSVSVPPCPEKCSICQKSCPTGSLCAPYAMNPTSCVSFITTFGQGNVPSGLKESQLQEWICGCDACQDACPYNRRHDWSAGQGFPGLCELEELLQPEQILTATDKVLAEKVTTRTDSHIPPSQTETLRKSAARVLKNKNR